MQQLKSVIEPAQYFAAAVVGVSGSGASVTASVVIVVASVVGSVVASVVVSAGALDSTSYQ